MILRDRRTSSCRTDVRLTDLPQVREIINNVLSEVREVQGRHDGWSSLCQVKLKLEMLNLPSPFPETDLEISSDVGQLEVSWEIKVREVSHLREVEEAGLVLAHRLALPLEGRHVLRLLSLTSSPGSVTATTWMGSSGMFMENALQKIGF